MDMKHFQRLLLLVVALMVGGGLGYIFLVGFEPMKMLIFAVACLVLGEVLYQIDRKIVGR